MGIKVANARKLDGPKDGVLRVYVGRASSKERAMQLMSGEKVFDASILGNPFTPKNRSEAERVRVIHEFKKWLWEQIKRQNKVWVELIQLRNLARIMDLELVCWCAPLSCHGDVIKSCLEWMLETNLKQISA